MRGLELPTLLRVLREDANFTQTELGVRINRDRTWVSRIENGKEAIGLDDTVSWVLATNGGEKFIREMARICDVKEIGIDTLIQARSVIQMAQMFSNQLGQLAL